MCVNDLSVVKNVIKKFPLKELFIEIKIMILQCESSLLFCVLHRLTARLVPTQPLKRKDYGNWMESLSGHIIHPFSTWLVMQCTAQFPPDCIETRDQGWGCVKTNMLKKGSIPTIRDSTASM